MATIPEKELENREDKVIRFLKKLDTWQPSSKQEGNGEDHKIFRRRKSKRCYCGWHSQGKETFNPDQTKYWKKNKWLFWRRILKKYIVREKGKHEKSL